MLKPDIVREMSQVSLVSYSEKVIEKERHFQDEAAHSFDLETGGMDEWGKTRT